jgi:hypothetical protein
VWIYTRSNGVWVQQGGKLIGSGAVGSADQGVSVSLSGDGNTALVGGYGDDSFTGAAWVYIRSVGVWTQQGNKLVGTGAVGAPNQGIQQGYSVALSADGNTAIVGGPYDNSEAGAAWVFTRSNGTWAQQGNKLVGTGTVGSAQQGSSVALSGDGNTAIVGGPLGNSRAGATWVYTRNGDVWTQQGSVLVGTGAVGNAVQGNSVALSTDGNTEIVGGPLDSANTGAAWIFIRSGGVWTQQGNKLAGTDAIAPAQQGNSVALSGNGNTAFVGGPYDNSYTGAAWAYTRNGGVWTQQGNKLVGTGASGNAVQGISVALSGDGSTAIIGGDNDASPAGAAWVFVQPSLQVTPAAGMVAVGNPGGPFAPSSFQYQLSASVGSINYSISGYPNWLTPSSTSGAASTTGTTVTFTVNANANSLAVGTYGPTTVIFANSDTGYGTTTAHVRQAYLTLHQSEAISGISEDKQPVVGGFEFDQWRKEAKPVPITWLDVRKNLSAIEQKQTPIGRWAKEVCNFLGIRGVRSFHGFSDVVLNCNFCDVAFREHSELPKSPADLPQYQSEVRPFADEAMKIVYVEYDLPGPNRMPWSARRLAIATTSGSRRAPSPEAISPVALPAPSAASEEEPDNPFREDFTNEVM